MRADGSGMEECLAAKAAILKARAANERPKRPAEEELLALDSSIKKNGALVKRFKVLSESTVDGLLRDLRTVNQSRFVAEAANALLEAVVKPVVVPSVIQVASEMHMRYAGFATALASALQKQLEAPLAVTERAAVVARKAALKLAVGLQLHGVVDTVAILRAALAALAETEFESADAYTVAALAQLTTFVRAGREDILLKPLEPEGEAVAAAATEEGDGAGAAAAGPTGRSDDGRVAGRGAQVQAEAALQTRYMLPLSAAESLIAAVNTAFARASAALEALHASLSSTEERHAEIVLARGALPASLAEKYDVKRRQYAAFREAFESFAAAWGEPMPQLKAANALRTADGGAISVVSLSLEDSLAAAHLWEDDATAAFYGCLPDLEAQVPSLALQKDAEPPAAGKAQSGEGAGSAESAGGDEEDGLGVVAAEEGSERGGGERENGLEDCEGGDASADVTEAAGESEMSAMRSILDQLPMCTSQDRADELAVNFCLIQTKGRRKSLAKALSDISRLPLQLLPFYARITATLRAHFPDVAAPVATSLVSRNRGMAKHRDASTRTLETRLRAARYLAELAKFRVVAAGDFFLCLKACLDDFSGNNIDAACELVTGAGAFMARQPDTNARMENFLGIMVRQRGGRNLDPSKAALIDCASFACKPMAAAAARGPPLTPLQRYIRHLLLDGTAAGDAEERVRRLRRLPWNECEQFVVGTTLKAAAKGRFDQIDTLASMVAMLLKPRPSFVVALVDDLLEALHSDLLDPHATAAQKRLAHMHFFAQLYKYTVVKTQNFLFVLHLLVTLGYERPAAMEHLDPSASFIRVRLVFTLLRTCGHYFVGRSSQSKLARFIVLLQRYVLTKEPLPADLEHEFQGFLTKLSPGGIRYATLDEADAALAELAKQSVQQGGEDGAADADAIPRGLEAGGGGHGLAPRSPGGGSVGSSRSAAEAGVEDDGTVRLAAEWLEQQEREADEQFEEELAALLPATAAPTAPPEATATGAAAAAGSPVDFRVRMRRIGARGDETKPVQLPATSCLAARIHAAREAEARERGEMKALVMRAAEMAADDGPGGPGAGRGGGARKSYMARKHERTFKLGQASYASELQVRGAL